MEQSTELKWKGRWDQVKGKARETWGDLTDDDLDVAEGQFEQLVGRIAERTGKGQEEVRKTLDRDDY